MTNFFIYDYVILEVGFHNKNSDNNYLNIVGNLNMSVNGANISLGGGSIYWDNPNSRLVIKATTFLRKKSSWSQKNYYYTFGVIKYNSTYFFRKTIFFQKTKTPWFLC